MTRRQFINRMGRWSALVLALGAIPACSAKLRPDDLEAVAALEGKMRTLSLKEVARQKLHHGPDIFLNPFDPHFHHKRNFWRLLQWKLFSPNPHKSQYAHERVTPIYFNWHQVRSHQGLSITYLPHAGVMIKDKGTYLMIDPIFFGLSGWAKNYTPIAAGLDEMPAPDWLLLTHGHFDHMDKKTLEGLDGATRVLSPLGYNEIFQDLALRQRTQLDWFDVFDDGRRRIHLLPCHHWTMRNPITGPNRSLWGSYLIETATGPVIYFSGDTAFFDRIDEIGKSFNINLAIFSVGAYEPRWFMRSSHMNPDETLQAFQALGADEMMIVHWGTFRLGNEPVFDPPLKMASVMAQSSMTDRLIPLSHGQTLFYA